MTVFAHRAALLWALVLTGWVGHGAAQPSVTVYGVLDLGISHANNGSSVNPGVGTRGATVMQQGTASRLGFKGHEDLGGGLYVGFDLQHRFFADTGTQDSDAFFKGVSAITLGNRHWGEFYLGREVVPAYYLSCTGDPTCWSFTSQPGQPYAWANYNGSVASDNSGIRRNNAVGYRSPKVGGWSYEVAYAAGEGLRKRSLGWNVQYAQGPVYAALGYDGSDAQNRLFIAAGGYDFGMVRPLFTLSDARGGPTTPDYQGQSISATLVFPTPKGRVFAGAGHLRARATPANDEVRSTKVFLGWDYSLSRKTSLYANFGSAQSTALTRSTAYDTGIRHAF